MTSTKCPKCGADMDPKKPCTECGHEINDPEHSEDGIKPPKIEEEDPKPNEGKDGGCGAKGKKGNAFGIIEAHLQDAQNLLPLVYPVTTETLAPPLSR